jgi:hypothetical protein
MAKTKLLIIKAVLAITRMLDADFVQRLYKIYEGLLNNPAYTELPVDVVMFKAAIDTYAASVTAALDGGKAAITARDKRRAEVALLYRQLGYYVEGACKGDLNTIISSGFVPKKPSIRGVAQPVDVPCIASVVQGSSGQLLVTIKRVKRAATYNIRYVPVSAAGTPVNWTTVQVTRVEAGNAINNLTPGTMYTFQVQALGSLGLSDWSDAVNRMTT